MRAQAVPNMTNVDVAALLEFEMYLTSYYWAVTTSECFGSTFRPKPGRLECLRKLHTHTRTAVLSRYHCRHGSLSQRLAARPSVSTVGYGDISAITR